MGEDPAAVVAEAAAEAGEPKDEPSRVGRLSALAGGTLAPLLFVITFLVLGATRDGYRPWRNFVSQLATGDGGWMQIANFVLCGALILGGAIALRGEGGRRGVAALVGIIGLGLILAGVFVTDPGFGYPVGEPVPREPTFHDIVHQLASLVVFIVLGVAPVVDALATRRREPVWSAYSALTGVATLALFAATVYAARAGDATTPLGIIQRLSIVVGFAWLSVLFARAATHARVTA